jgi:hypothetical protein
MFGGVKRRDDLWGMKNYENTIRCDFGKYPDGIIFWNGAFYAPIKEGVYSEIPKYAKVQGDLDLSNVPNVYRVGNSGIASRNLWFLDTATVQQTVFIPMVNGVVPFYPWNDDEVSFREEIMNVPQLTDYTVNQKTLTDAYQSALKVFADREIAKIKAFQKMECFNNTRIYQYYKLDVPGCMILHTYTTGCSNATVCIAPLSNQVRVPDSLKALVIGKNGTNIREVCLKYKMRITII